MDTVVGASAKDRRDGHVAAPSMGSRRSGAAVAATIAVVAALIALRAGTPFLLLGVPAATIAGWLLGAKVRPAGGVANMSLAIALVTTAIADALYLIPFVMSSTRVDLLGSMASLMFWSVVGLVVFGIPMLFVTVPCGLVWAVLVQRLAHDGGRTASGPRRGTA